MKVLLIYLEEKKEDTDRFKSLFREKEIPVEILSIKSQDETRKNVEKQFTAFFAPLLPETGAALTDTPTHVAIFSPLAPGWIDFFAGFSCGSRVPFLVCGEEAIQCIPEAFTFCFKFFDSDAAFKNYLETECELHRKMEFDKGAKTARETLLKMGVPVNEESLADCVAENRLQEVLHFIAAGFSPDTRNKAGVPLVSIAARNGNREIIRNLFLAGAKMDLRANDRGTTPLLDSVMAKHYELAKDFIKTGADVNSQSKDGQTALIIAVGAGDDRMAEVLFKAGADPDISDSMGASARQYAVLFRKNAITNLFDTNAPKKTG
jgi:hypothetical protein